MRVVLCWSGVSGYTAACWRALAALLEIDLFVIAWAEEQHVSFDSERLMDDIPHRLLHGDERYDSDLVISLIRQHDPQVLVVPGWSHPAYMKAALRSEFSGVKLLVAIDTPWRGTWRQRLAKWKLSRLLSRLDAMVVAGERSWQYARRLGIPESKILRGVYGFDPNPLEPVCHRRLANDTGWPRQFLYVGRYVPDKAIDVLVEGYRQYRLQSESPWGLTCCGLGPESAKIQRIEGATDRGFVQPDKMPDLFEKHGAFVIASRYEPWGVAIAEAQYAGLPVVCTEACGASVEIVRHMASGLIVPTDDPTALANALFWIEQHPDHLAAMGQLGKWLASPFSAELWAQRWKCKMEQLL